MSEFKVVLLSGTSAVGNSSILDILMGREFDEQRGWTVGGAYDYKIITVDQSSLN